MATEEVSNFLNKKRNSVDADVLVPYLVLVTVTACHELYSPMTLEHSDSSIPITSAYFLDPRTEGFRVRLLMMEHFSIHRASMAM